MAKIVKTDGDVVRTAKRIDALRDEISDLIRSIRDSEHPNADAIQDALYNECWFAAWAQHIVMDHLAKPDEWDYHRVAGSDSQLAPYHKAADKARKTRRNNGK